MFKNFNFKSILSIVIISLFIGVIFVYADWTPQPASAPTCPDSEPACNPPINVGSQSQYKEGAFGIGGVLRGYSGAIFDGNVGIGTASPGAKLDVSGQIKSSSGGFVFPDGTIQATAVSVAASTYVFSGAAGCPTGDTAIAYRTIPQTCNGYTKCNDGSCGNSCTTGYHDWGSNSSRETCSYSGGKCDSRGGCQSTGVVTCYAELLSLCNP